MLHRFNFYEALNASLLHRFIAANFYSALIASSPLLFKENYRLTLHRRYFFKEIHRLTLHRCYFLNEIHRLTLHRRYFLK
jgi:hypothetical protein